MKKFIIFLAGVATGSAATYFIVKKKIEDRADKEIESVIDTFKKRFDSVEELLTDEQKTELGLSNKKINKIDNEENEQYDLKVQNFGYSENDDEHANDITDEIKDEEIFSPYVISVDEFGENDNDETTLILYSDGVLADEEDDIIDDPESIIGDCLDGFDESDDDTIYIRNENNETDYVIIKSEKKFVDILPEVDD